MQKRKEKSNNKRKRRQQQVIHEMFVKQHLLIGGDCLRFCWFLALATFFAGTQRPRWHRCWPVDQQRQSEWLRHTSAQSSSSSWNPISFLMNVSFENHIDWWSSTPVVDTDCPIKQSWSTQSSSYRFLVTSQRRADQKNFYSKKKWNKYFYKEQKSTSIKWC